MDRSKIEGFFNTIFGFIGEVFKALGKFFMRFGTVIGVIVGIFIIVVSTLAITAVGFAATALVFNTNSPFLEIPEGTIETIGQGLLPLAAIAVFFVAFVPIMFLILLGASLVGRKNAFSLPSSLILIGFWMVAVIVVGVIGLDAAPRIEKQIKAYNSNSELLSREIEIDNFNKIDIGHAYEARIVPGNEYRVVAIGREKDLDRMDIKVVAGELVVKRGAQKVCLFCYTKRVILEITAPSIIELEVSGASKVAASGFSGDRFELILSGASSGDFDLVFNRFDIDVSGASDIRLNLTYSNEIDAEISGASEAEILGMVNNLRADISGASVLNSYYLEAINADIEVSGASRAEVNASKKLDIDSSGAGKVYYRGNPEIDSNEESNVRPEIFEVE